MQVSSVSASSASAAALAIKPKVDDQTPGAANDASDAPSVRITLSDTAKAALAGGDTTPTATPTTSAATATKAVNGLLANSGGAIYGAAISSLKTYPTDLSTRYDELAAKKSLTPDETAEALKLNQERNAREDQFFQYARQAGAAATPQERSRLMAQYNKAYTEYYDGLSPAEQASPRYAGTRAGAVSDYSSWSKEAGDKPDDLSASGDPVLMLFDKIKQQAFNVDDDGAKSVLQDYKDGVAKLNSTLTDPQGNAALVSQASSNFNAVQSVADKARSGDGDAFGQLQALANDPSSLSNFLSYAQSLTA